jgi:hypothetical protein
MEKTVERKRLCTASRRACHYPASEAQRSQQGESARFVKMPGLKWRPAGMRIEVAAEAGPGRGNKGLVSEFPL